MKSKNSAETCVHRFGVRPPEKVVMEHFVAAQQACPWVPDEGEHKEVLPRFITNVLLTRHFAKLVAFTALFPAISQA